jgi:uncharacterized protein (UPF0332 family)
MEFLLERGRLESVAVDVEGACDALLERATKRMDTARSALTGEDWEGAFSNAYDVYRMSAEALLLRQGLRATGGEGSHAAVEDAVSAQFSDGITGFSKVRFERMRQGRHGLSISTLRGRRRRTMMLGGLSTWPGRFSPRSESS